MRDHSDREPIVLCGHTHGSGDVRSPPNLLVQSGGARYGFPEPQDVLEIE